MKKPPPKWRAWLIALLVLAVLVLLFEWEAASNESLRCWTLRQSILSALDNASSVKVIEHTCSEDSPTTVYDPAFKEKILATITLTPEQIAALRAAMPQSRDISSTTVTACIFEEHHRIEIVERDGSVFVLRLCFHCGELIANDKEGQRIMPIGWPRSLGQFFSSLGLHPKGPWR